MRIFQPDKESFNALINEKPKNILICSPWISKEGILMLKETILSRDLSELSCCEIWLRVMVEDYVYSRTDYFGLLEFCHQLIDITKSDILSIRHNKKLHAKIYNCDDSYIIGSANLTRGGFSNNIEIMLEDRQYHNEMMTSLKIFKEKMTLITLNEFKYFLGKCKQENIIKLKKQVENLDDNISRNRIKIPVLGTKKPPHYGFSWK